MKLEDVINEIEKIAPSATQEDWDNSGLQIAVRGSGIRKIMTALEITDEIVSEAIEKDVDLIVTHHPLIFGNLQSIDSARIEGQYILDLVKNSISVYSSHTPFDMCSGGNNDYIASELGLVDIEGFTVKKDGMLIKDPIGRTGYLPEPLTLGELTEITADILDIDRQCIRTVGDLSETIKKAAICTGAGADFIETAVDNGCDVLITGDVKYHDAQKARATGMCVIDAGHYGTEKTFSHNIAEMLIKRLRDQAEIIEASADIDPFTK